MRSTRCPGASKAAAGVDGQTRARARRGRTPIGRPPAASVIARRTTSRASAGGQRARARVASIRHASPVATARRSAHSSSAAALEPLPLVARELGLVGQHVDDRRVEPLLEQRQQLGADAVARNAHVVVRLVVDVSDAAAPSRYARSSRAPAVEQRPDDRAAPRVHARRARASRRRAAGAAETSRPDRRACGRARRRRRRSATRARSKNAWRAVRAASSIDRRSRARAAPRRPSRRRRAAGRATRPASTQNALVARRPRRAADG